MKVWPSHVLVSCWYAAEKRIPSHVGTVRPGAVRNSDPDYRGRSEGSVAH
jgi:hypothetical protein